MSGFYIPCRRYSKTFVASVEKSQNITTKDVANVFHSWNTGTIWLDRPMSDVETCIYYGYFVFFSSVLKKITQMK